MDPLTTVSTRHTHQSEKATPEQVKNSAGGYVFALGDDARIHRFLTLGTTGGTYYTSERDLTKTNTDLVLNVARTRGEWLVEQAVTISVAGRAPKQNPAIFALAAVAGLGDDAGRKAALAAVPAVCRTGTTLFLFTRYVEQFRGWGRGLRRAVGAWFLDKDVDQVAYQAVKYRQRDGWSMKDLLRLAHPDTEDPARKGLFDWICGHDQALDSVPPLVAAFEAAQETTRPDMWVSLIADQPLSWEMLPDAALTNPRVWQALIERGMPQTALLRQLPRLTRLGVLDDRATLSTVLAQLVDPERLRKARVHPINLLVALRTYSSGQSVAGSSSWMPNRRVIDALDAAFYLSFGTVEPAGKRTLVALDVSGSMGFSTISGLPLTPREASAALALVTMATEPDCDVVGFTAAGGGLFQRRNNTAITELPISPRQRLDDAVRAVSNLPFGSTDCALPMLWAKENGRVYDTIQIITDNETWAGAVHPHQALRDYRARVGVNTRLVVVGMTATDFTIADPGDPGQLDVAGFDSAVPNLIADFSRGDI